MTGRKTAAGDVSCEGGTPGFVLSEEDLADKNYENVKNMKFKNLENVI